MASDATTPQAAAAAAVKKPKLHGRAFYESLGSPKYIVAPMVDQSEFVSPVSLASLASLMPL
jgi:tRNA-dihydrouridine synthase 1